jgi:(p)ppGpp synthase/HD superfamily hydrolase
MRTYGFAAEAHEYRTADGAPQVRKFSGEPYITHPIAVAGILYNMPGGSMDIGMLQAALLHDVVEDTTVEIEEIEREFGTDVAYLVRGLTKKSLGRPENRTFRKDLDRVAYASYCNRVQTVKVADIMHNSYSATVEGTKNYEKTAWAKMWLGEAQELLAALMMADENLRDKAIDMIDQDIVLVNMA